MLSDAVKASKSSSKVLKPLKRGKACMSCRFLKIKCDGEKPVCGPCQAHPRDDECEYADGPGRSRTKVLEDTVSRLEARLLELENPESSTPSVMLHDPYHDLKVQRLSKSPPLNLPDAVFAPPSLSPFSPTSTTSSLPSGRHRETFSRLEANTELTGSSGSSTSPLRYPVPMPYIGMEEPSLGNLQTSFDNFFPHAQQFGFFMNIPTFRRSALLAFQLGHPGRPTPGLLSVVHLLGVHFSQPEAMQNQETALLTRAVQHVATDLFGTHPNKVIQTLQAEVLLSYYFLRTGLLLEAKYRAGTAVSLALASGLHKIRSANVTAPSTLGIMHDQPFTLPPPADRLQEAERINGFWTVLTLHKCITVALESPAQVCGALEAPGMQIDTPWPVNMENFEEVSRPVYFSVGNFDRPHLPNCYQRQQDMLQPDLRGNSTVRAFLNGYSGENDSAFTLTTKAAILFHRAAHLTGQWSPTMTQRDQQAYDAAAKSVNSLIEAFRTRLRPIATYDAHDRGIRNAILTHALIDAASIKLHWIFAYAYPMSKQICLSAARNIVNYGDLNLQNIGYINPIMGNLWMTACLVFVDEISRTRQIQSTSTWSEHQDGLGLEEELMESYRNGLKALSLFSQESPLMRYQLTKVQEAFEAI